MSVEASKWAWEQKGISAGEKLVLLCLADHADEQGKNCYPGQVRIAAKTGLSRETVSRALAKLEAAGVIKIFKVPLQDAGPIQANLYHLLLQRVTKDHTDVTKSHNRVTFFGSTCDILPPSTCDLTSHKPSLRNRHKEGGGGSPVATQAPPLQKTEIQIGSEMHEWPTPETLLVLYNHETADELTASQVISPERRKKAGEYLTRFPEAEFWREAFAETKKSEMLRGLKHDNGHEHFKADFDFFLRRGKDGIENVVKTYEGKYRDG